MHTNQPFSRFTIHRVSNMVARTTDSIRYSSTYSTLLRLAHKYLSEMFMRNYRNGFQLLRHFVKRITSWTSLRWQYWAIGIRYDIRVCSTFACALYSILVGTLSFLLTFVFIPTVYTICIITYYLLYELHTPMLKFFNSFVFKLSKILGLFIHINTNTLIKQPTPMWEPLNWILPSY